MNLAAIIESMPDYARDLKLNLQNVLAQTELTEQQTWTVAVACALTARNGMLSSAILEEAANKLSPEQLSSAKAAFALMGMNNVYYRFKHMVANEEYDPIPARLRMQLIRSHGGDPVDFELACLAASAIKGCEACVKSHDKVVREKGLSAEAVVASVRIASTLHAVAAVIEAESI
ncbi:MAG: carboxymuconolactone decarboxylase family protein [Bryobacteraceae bacterium]|jgi:lipoyl-dependent peroxiredoxin subunit D|nr:carboxymuconolactone decarboxylase family protein [Bryobacteraceae bacterium]